MLKECPHCGAKNPEEAEKCQFCGKRFDEPVSEKPVPFEQPQKNLGQRKLISNTFYTIFYQLSSVAVLGIFGIGTYLSFRDDIISAIGMAIITILLYFLYAKLWFTCKKVKIDSVYLYISDYFTIYPPILLTEISNISYTTGARWHFPRITIEFKSETSAGKKVSFLPKGFFSPDMDSGLKYVRPLVEELEKLAGIKHIDEDINSL